MPAALTVYGLKTCDTTRKALKELDKAGQVTRFQDIRETPLTEVQIAEILGALGDKAVNRASTTWRQLPEEDRAAAPEVLLSRFPTLLKRPVIRSGPDWFLGWTPAVCAKLIGMA